MTIQFYPEELDYVNAKMHPLGLTDPSSFLGAFLLACLRADNENYELLRPALRALMVKYPADAERLKIERVERGAE